VFTIPPLTSDILTLSFDAQSSPSIKIELPQKVAGSHSHGWGFGWYPNNHLSAMVTKDPAAHGEQVLVDAITDWSNFRSTVFFCKVRGASKGYSSKETQPFARSFAGRDWLFMHNGDLDKAALNTLHGTQSRLLEPLGNTDSELAFCNLLAHMHTGDGRKITDINPNIWLDWFRQYDELGSADMYLSDGESTLCFHGTQSSKGLYYARLQPPHRLSHYTAEAAQILLPDPRDSHRTLLIVSSSPFAEGEWQAMQPGQLIIIRRGNIVWNSLPTSQTPTEAPVATPPQPADVETPQVADEPSANKSSNKSSNKSPNKQSQAHILNTRAITETKDGQALKYRLFEITHNTYYDYSAAVEHSTHTFRLQPTDDPIQEVVTSKLTISSPAEEIQYEDVFGNQAIYYIIGKPYTKLAVEATSVVKIFAAPPDDHSLSRRQTSIPLAWMPWQRQMMMPYLLPIELPESQLIELTDYAMSFVERNDYHLLKTIEDINTSIYQDYNYVSSSTSLITTPFEVYTSRQGVCQDFANLFICLTRLLSIPARYRMGYIYTGAHYTNKIQSDASHAWAEVYLPYVGWRGFDPTNGCLVSQDHIRVACGRNYLDATPTSGTIYKGGGEEILAIEVKMRELFE